MSSWRLSLSRSGARSGRAGIAFQEPHGMRTAGEAGRPPPVPHPSGASSPGPARPLSVREKAARLCGMKDGGNGRLEDLPPGDKIGLAERPREIEKGPGKGRGYRPAGSLMLLSLKSAGRAPLPDADDEPGQRPAGEGDAGPHPGAISLRKLRGDGVGESAVERQGKGDLGVPGHFFPRSAITFCMSCQTSRLMPGVALVPHDIGRMKGRHDPDRPEVMKIPPQAAHAGRRRNEEIGRRFAERDDDDRSDRPDLGEKIRLAGLDLGPERGPVVGRAALDDVRDVDFFPRNLMAAMILVRSWPARPTNGRPWRSSSAPGASPTNMRGVS